jgi:hypothetical protein
MANVQLIRSVDHYDVEPLMAHEGLVIGIDLRHVELPSHLLGEIEVAIADRNDVQFRMSMQAFDKALALTEADDPDIEMRPNLPVATMGFHNVYTPT